MAFRIVGPAAAYLSTLRDGDDWRIIVMQPLADAAFSSVTIEQDTADGTVTTEVPLRIVTSPARILDYVRRGDGAHVIGEADRFMSRAQVLLAPSPDRHYLPGLVLGQVTSTGQFAHMDVTATDGRQNAAGILFGGKRASSEVQMGAAHIGQQSRHNGHKLIYPVGATGEQIEALIERLNFLGMTISF